MKTLQNKKHIAILSMQRIVNFGSVLQAWSLQQLIREITGAEVSFLDIDDSGYVPCCRSVTESADYTQPAAYPPGLLQKAKRWCIARLSAYNRSKIRRFMAQQLKLNAPAVDSYDCVVVGSDEVFNHAKNVRLQLHGNVKNTKQLITYAASCGSACAADIAPEYRQTVRQAMANYKIISVRDSATRAYVDSLYDGPVVQHLDPVLTGPLYQRAPGKVPLKKYLLVYAYGQRIRTAQEICAIERFAKKHGLKTVAMGGSQFWCDLYIPASPMKLLDYFHNADYVVTDTFHGTIFSVLNKKQFAVIIRKTNNNKLTGLLEDLQLTGRQLTDPEKLEQLLTEKIDYVPVDRILEQERLRTRAYLQEQLGEGYEQDPAL